MLYTIVQLYWLAICSFNDCSYTFPDDEFNVLETCRTLNINIVTYSGFSIHDGTLLHSKGQYTTVKHSRKLLEHTYTSGPHSLGTLSPIEFFQQDLLWQSSNTHCHSCSQKAFKHTSGQSIVGLSVHLHTTTAPRRIVSPSLTCHLPAPTHKHVCP
jgi:hypothetical protein